ncbi:MAG: hypothetical protein H5U14_10985, partial [Roseovarius sp.]|nr:hypothetical protein [Roseovarius sp.]
PLERIDDAKSLIEQTTGVQGPDVGHENKTFRNRGEFSVDFEERFRHKAALDMEVFLRAQDMFAEKMAY